MLGEYEVTEAAVAVKAAFYSRLRGLFCTLGCGRLVRVTAESPGGGDLQPVVYVVAVEDPAKAIEIIRAGVQVNANIEFLGRAAEELLNALKLTPGQVVRA